MYLKNEDNTEDIFQTVFLKYVLGSVSFEGDEHEKAWFIGVTINACIGMWYICIILKNIPHLR